MPRGKILLVDDDRDFIEIIRAPLEKDFLVQTAASGKEALALVAQEPPDVIVLDVMMTHLSEGFDVARRLKGDPKTQRIPILMLTGVDDVYDFRSQAEESQRGCDRYLAKPPNPRELLAAIDDLLACAAKQQST